MAEADDIIEAVRKHGLSSPMEHKRAMALTREQILNEAEAIRQEGRAPSPEEMAKRLGVTAHELAEVFQAQVEVYTRAIGQIARTISEVGQQMPNTPERTTIPNRATRRARKHGMGRKAQYGFRHYQGKGK